MATAPPAPPPTRAHTDFPLPALAVMACTGFLVIMTETLPAGLLPSWPLDCRCLRAARANW